MMAESWALLRRCVGPSGDPTRERIFRMNITVCMHRAASDDDLERLPPSFFESEPTDLAGGPVEVLWENEEGSLSTQPCHNPERIPLDARNPLLWFPGACTACPPCQARSAHDTRPDDTENGRGSVVREEGREPRLLADMLDDARRRISGAR